MKYRFIVPLFLLPLISSAQDYRLQTLFVYNFARYIEWPTEKQQGAFVIGVVGRPSIVSQFKTNLEGKSKGLQKIVIHDLSVDNAYATCHMIFIVNDQTKQLGTIMQAVANQSVIVVTEKEGSLVEGSSINMVVREGKMVFELNEQVKKSKFKISAEILRMTKS